MLVHSHPSLIRAEKDSGDILRRKERAREGYIMKDSRVM